MSDDDFSKDRVYARHARVKGAVLVIGVGAVGSFVAEELASIGISPLRLVDPDVLIEENLIRSALRRPSLGHPKASGLAAQIKSDFPWCNVKGRDSNFLELPEHVQFELVSNADVVVIAADDEVCRRRVNKLCIEAEVPAVYPAIWVSNDMRPAEVGEVFWTMPGRYTPCYECWLDSRRDRQGGEDGTGEATRPDIEVVVLATVSVVRALLPERERVQVLDRARNLILVHSFMPTSGSVQRLFHGRGFQILSRADRSGFRSRAVRVQFPSEPCPACGGHQNLSGEPEMLFGEGLGSLREASRGVGRREREQARERDRLASERLAEERRRTLLWNSANQQYTRISTILKDTILSVAREARYRTTSIVCELRLGSGMLEFSSDLGRLPTDLVTSPTFKFLEAKEWSTKVGAPFDVIGFFHVIVSCRRRADNYVGRAHTLWFCDAQHQGQYGFYETAFADATRRYTGKYAEDTWVVRRDEPHFSGICVPMALSPEDKDVRAAFGVNPGQWDIVWPFTLIDPNQLDDFIQRWAGWFAAAAEDRLEMPLRVPERNPIGSWRIGNA